MSFKFLAGSPDVELETGTGKNYAYIKATSKTVRSFIEEVSKAVGDIITVVAFDRFELGQQ